MGDTTNIAWCKSTFNPFIGCTKISPGCDSCYAEALDKRHKWGGATHWGAGIPRYRTSASNWKKPLQWNKEQQRIIDAGGGDIFPLEPWRVFCASLADVFDNEVPAEWRADLMKLIVDTPHLSWLLVTKRIGNVERMIEEAGDLIDYGEGWQSMWGQGVWPENVRLMITVVNQEEADRDIPKLLALPCKNGISYEPALGPVDWTRWLGKQCDGGSVPGPYGMGGVTCPRCMGNTGRHDCPGLEWIIVGGESNQGQHKARPFDVRWARDTVQQCKAAGVPVFVKQLGSNPAPLSVEAGSVRERLWLKDRAGADPSEWPEDLRVREFPR